METANKKRNKNYKLDYNIGEVVYLKTDHEQLGRIVTAINIRDTGINYELSCITQTSWHYYFEISREKDFLKLTE